MSRTLLCTCSKTLGQLRLSQFLIQLLVLAVLGDWLPSALVIVNANQHIHDAVALEEITKSLYDSSPMVRSRGVHSRHTRSTCGGTFSADTLQKVITSPNYPGDYHNSANCFYSIEVPEGHFVEIVFHDFRIEIPRTSSSNCTYDGLTVYDGVTNGEPMGRYCGKVTPPDFRSRTNRVYLHLYSDESLGFRGFRLTYTVHCGAAFFTEHGTLRFAEEDHRISPNKQCEYELTATPDHYLDLNFTVYQLKTTDVVIIDSGNVIRTLRSSYEYESMVVRVVSVSNVVRVRFTYTGTGTGSVIIAYQAHKRVVVSGAPVFLYNMFTCKGLSTSETDTKAALASNTTKDAVLHRLERVGGRVNDTIQSGNEVYIRTAATPSVATNTGWSLTASRDGSTAYEDWAQDNSTWLIRGDLRHGGRVWLENKEMTGQYLGMFGKQESGADTVKIHVGLCSNPVDWVIFKIPLDFGWDKYSDKGAYQARWVDGLPMAAYQSCLRHPAVFPRCDGSPVPSCLS